MARPGASLRATYLETIRKAGFAEIRVDREASFLDAIALDDPAVQSLVNPLGLSAEEVKEYAASVTSLHIFARKA